MKQRQKVESVQRKQAGFTLIELVVVIVILGILAATAIPRFIDLSADAKEASQGGLVGAVRSASALVRAQALVEDVTNGTIVIEGDTVNIVEGFAAADATNPGIEVAVEAEEVSVACTSATPGNCVWTLDSDNNCTVTYTEATGTARPVITRSTCP